MSQELIRNTALETIQMEAASVEALLHYVDDAFLLAVQKIHEGRGRVVVSGIGKSAIIAQKIVATFNSTGTPSLFLHAADAIHGDLGMMQSEDIAILISKSGESPEIKVLVPLIKNFGNTLIGLCGKASSFLATQADIFLNCTVEQEACPNNLAPTNSTTAQLVMGDALAVCLLKLKGFTSNDFARYHPGGALGKQLYLRVSDLSKNNAIPKVKAESSMAETIVEISSKRLGATAVMDNEEKMLGIITDGDIRRILEKHSDLSFIRAKDIMNPTPKTIQEEALAVDALALIRQFNITQLVILNQEHHYCGILHLHDLLREGII